MDDITVAFLKRVYKEYYFKNSFRIEFPSNMEQREFGYIPFGGGMIRHLSFKTPGELMVELLRHAPSSVYCSNATYANPSLPMEEKGWRGAELIFDIDADSIPTPCKSKHNRWYCQRCYLDGRLPRPEECPSCHSVETTKISWTCKECLDSTKEHAYHLLDFLTKDFGVSSSGIKTYFSGNRGYHLHVLDERLERLDAQARAEIANYVRGTGLNVQGLVRHGRFHDGYGWAGRIGNILSSTADPTFARRSASKRFASEILLKTSSLIDQSVTTDIHRIFRMCGTLHGSSGMVKLRISSLEGFDPEVDPVVLGDEDVKVLVGFAPAFTMKGKRFGPYKRESANLPTYAAVYLLGKGLAKKE